MQFTENVKFAYSPRHSPGRGREETLIDLSECGVETGF